MKTYVIGDIHGCYDQLVELLLKLKSDQVDFFYDKIIFLGDYIDRGPKSKEVIDLLIYLEETYGKDHVIALKGNHEDMCLHNYGLYEKNSRELANAWWYNGGMEAIKSYEEEGVTYDKDNPCRMSKEHQEWLLTLRTSYEDEDGIYVHAGLSPHMVKTSEYLMLWTREEFIRSEKDFGKRVYFGHTPQKGVPLVLPNKTGLDTACVFGYTLSCLCIQDDELFQVKGYTNG